MAGIPEGPIVVIPSRLASSRLPNKALADIAGEPMIVHVWRRAMEARIGPVLVACGDRVIADVIERAGGKAVLTDPALPSGSDRVFQALESVDPDGRFDPVVGFQGDLPTIDPDLPAAAVEALNTMHADIGTLVCSIKDADERTDSSVVKAVVAWRDERFGRALYFSRAAVPSGDGELLHHIGLYVFRRAALARFVSLPPSPLEKRERLEQLRALEGGMSIAAARVDTIPLGVDTPADLERARGLIAASKAAKPSPPTQA
jgi:3-deoxy-manno-octulosonate cytidylyltransferase (CMP-KDO synthetase)